jgi:chromosome segregation ATPase
MSGEDNGRNLEELARRMEAQAQKLEALERENRELREAVGASEPELETPQQQPQATQARDMTPGSSKTVRGLLLGPRDEQAYSRPLVGVLPSYVVGWLL